MRRNDKADHTGWFRKPSYVLRHDGCSESFGTDTLPSYILSSNNLVPGRLVDQPCVCNGIFGRLLHRQHDTMYPIERSMEFERPMPAISPLSRNIRILQRCGWFVDPVAANWHGLEPRNASKAESGRLWSFLAWFTVSLLRVHFSQLLETFYWFFSLEAVSPWASF